MALDWNEWSYRQCGINLGVEGLQASDKEIYDGLPTAARVKEEVLETFLMFHLEELTGLPLQFVSRSHMDQFTGGEDLVAWDALGRVHLFELKNGLNQQTVNRNTVEQLTQYTVKNLFRPAVDFIEQEWCEGNKIWWHEAILAGYLAGAYLNEIVSKFGYEEVTEHLTRERGGIKEWMNLGQWRPSIEALSKNWWKGRRASGNATLEEKNRLRFEAAIACAKKGLAEKNHADPGFLRELAGMWRMKQKRTKRPPLPKFKTQRPVVMWFIAPNTGAGHDAIIEWRAKGVDARAVEVDLRQDASQGTFQVRWRGEAYAARDEIEERLFQYASNEAAYNSRQPPRLKLKFYNEKRSSGSKRDGHGLPLKEPTARFEKVSEPNWEEISPSF
jgi:hypothetical protein